MREAPALEPDLCVLLHTHCKEPRCLFCKKTPKDVFLMSKELIVISCVPFQYVEEEAFVDAIKALSSVKKEHAMFTDTHL